jgi:predicted ATPase/class 3 adenylate cyclase
VPSEREPLPEGTITYVFTDVVGSTVLWDTEPDATRQAMVHHDAVVEAVIAEHNGMLVRPRGEGDSRFGVFRRATDAAAAALHIQRALAAEDWETSRPIQVRIALHMGEAEVRAGDYYGGAVNRCARLRSLAHPGQILVSDPVAQVIEEEMPAGAVLHDFGVHRLKDLSRPEHVRGLTGAGTLQEFPPLLSLSTVPNNLPVQVTPLIGRDADVAAIATRLDEGARLITITGPGGMGKTRLALHTAAEAAERFPGGVLLVPLESLGDAGSVGIAIADALGVGDEPGPPLDAVVAHIDRDRVLLVVDNFEHVLGAAGFVSDVLAQCPNACFLVTSRERLHLQGEAEWPLAPLALPEPRDSDDAADKAAAVELFVARARAVSPDFALTAATRALVVDVCRRLDGLPLAIELAAARTKLLGPAELIRRLESGGKVLGGRRADAPARHQTMLDTIAWSYELLDDRERSLFRRMSVFAGGATLTAIEAVCGDNADVLDEVASLVDKSLLCRDDSGAGETRFTMLRTIRDYAKDRLAESDERDEIHANHARHFAGCISEAEHDNVRAALEFLIATGDGAAAHALCAEAEGFWVRQGHVSEGREWLRRALAVESDDAAARAQARLVSGTLAAHQADFDFALEQLAAAEAELRRLGLDELARCLMARGNVLHELGDVDGALAALTDALESARGCGDDRAVARVLYNLGCVEHAEGGTAAARQYFEESLERSRQLHDEALVGASLGALGQVLLTNDDFEGARKLLEECLAIGRANADLPMVCMALDALGDVARYQGRFDDAEALLLEVLELEDELGDALGQVITLENLAELDRARGHAAAAATLLGAVDALREAEGMIRYGADRAENERTCDDLRTTLGVAQWDVAYGEGRAMSAAQACAFARAAALTPH